MTDRHRAVLMAALLLAVAVGAVAHTATAQAAAEPPTQLVRATAWAFAPADRLIALCVAGKETGGTYDSTLVGKAGEAGAWQIHPIHHRRLGVTPRTLQNPWVAARAARAVLDEARGWGSDWHGPWRATYRGCMGRR